MVLSHSLNGLRLLSSSVGAIPFIGSGLSTAVTFAITAGEMAEKAQENKELVESLADEAIHLLKDVVNHSQSIAKTNEVSLGDRAKDVDELVSVLEEILYLAEDKRNHNLTKRLLSKKDDKDTAEKLKRRLDQVKDRFIIISQLEAHDKLDRIQAFLTAPTIAYNTRFIHLKSGSDLAMSLNPVFEAQYSSSKTERIGCMKNTRTGVLNRINKWIEDEAVDTFFCLIGFAGSGKSTIAQTICEQLSETKRLGASFFFSRDEEERRNPENVIRTLAYQLAQSLPQLKEEIMKAITDHVDIMHRASQEQLQVLVSGPLSRAVNLPFPLVIVLDALDECDRHGGNLVELLAHAFQDLPPEVRVKILITSRSTRELHMKLEDVGPIIYRLHEIESTIVDAEIRTYLLHHLKRIAYAHPTMDQNAWPLESDLDALVERSGGLFIFAATAINYMKIEESPTSQLRNLLAQTPIAKTTDERYEQLDRLYLQVLNTARLVSVQESDWLDYLKRVAGAVALIPNPLPEEAFVRLLNYKLESTSAALHSLGAVIVIPDRPSENQSTSQVVRIFHPSFPDFITNPKRCGDERFLVKKSVHYALIARRCLEILNERLQTDICSIRDSSLLNSEAVGLGISVRQHIPAELAFACKFWLDSLLRATPGDPDIFSSLTTFCHKHVLNWIEACSLIGALSHVMAGLQQIHSFFKNSIEFERAHRILRDAERVLLNFFTPIAKCALQVYHSVHPLLPECALLDVANEHTSSSPPPSIPRPLTSRPTQWSTVLYALEGPESVYCMALSHDGEQLAAGSGFGYIWIWNPFTGQIISQWKGMPSLTCDAIAFTPDDKYLLVAQGRSVNVWNAVTATLKQKLEAYHTGPIKSLAVSPTQPRFLSGGDDGAIYVWDIQSGERVATLLGKNDERTLTVIYSKDGSHIFSSHRIELRESFPVHIWDAASGSKVGLLEGHTGMVNALFFADSDGLLISASYDNTIRIWDVALRKQIKLLGGHNASPRRVVAVGQASKLKIISGYSDGTIRVWSAHTGICLAHLNEHNYYVTSIVPFSDGTRICSAAEGRAVLVWSTEAFHSSPQPPKTRRLKALVRETYYEVKNAVKNANTSDKEELYLNSSTGLSVSAAAVSPDGSLLALGRRNGSIQLINVRSSEKPRELVFELNRVKLVEGLSFSVDGAWLLSTCLSDETQIWDVQTGKEVASFNKTLKTALFPNKKIIAATDTKKPGIIHILGIKNGKRILELDDKVHFDDYITTMQTSPDSRLLLSVSLSGRCSVWNVLKTSQLAAFPTPGPLEGVLAFTPTPTEHPNIDEKTTAALFHILEDGWVCGPVSHNGPVKRLLWLPPNRRTKECWFREGVLTAVSTSGTVTQLDISSLLHDLASKEV